MFNKILIFFKNILIQIYIFFIKLIYKNRLNNKIFEGRTFRSCINWSFIIPIEDKPINYLEIGSFNGSSVIDFSNIFGANKKSKLYCIDPWSDYDEYPEYKNLNNKNYDIFKKNIENNKLTDKVITLRGYSHEKIPELNDNFFDIIYVDGNHETKYVLQDGELALKKLKKNGFMIFDDYDWDTVKIAVDNFSKKYNYLERHDIYYGWKVKQVLFIN
tara:strand:- start:474 stop:1121 length:648 start_codon:yes stop_codon:yes gene_type:complete